MPVKNSSGEVIGVAQAINKITVQPFNEHDEKVSLARNVFSDKTKSVPDFGHQIIRLFSVNSDKMQIRWPRFTSRKPIIGTADYLSNNLDVILTSRSIETHFMLCRVNFYVGLFY